MHAWTYEPLNSVVIDFEYTPGRSGHRRSLQLAIANANGEWIVPNTNINYGKTRTDLASLLDRIIDTNVRFDSSQVLRKVYDSLDGGELTNWFTVQEISDLIGQYCKRCSRIKTVLFWAKNFADFTCLEELLQSAGRNDLVPTRPKLTVEPLTWWGLARTELGLEDSLSLNLGNVYELLFPERPELYENKHRAGSDVCMTIELIEFYFRKVRCQPQKGKIENYFSGGLGLKQNSHVEHGPGDDWESDAEGDWDSDAEDEWDSDAEDEWDSDVEGECDSNFRD